MNVSPISPITRRWFGDACLTVLVLAASPAAGTSFGPARAVVPESTAPAPSSMVAARLDAEGGTDLLWNVRHRDEISWFGQSDTFATLRTLSEESAERFNLAAGDLDGDGDTDVAAATGAGLRFYLNGGDGAWTASSPVPSITTPLRRLLVADADGDGDQDIFGYSEFGGANSLDLFLNPGSGPWPEPRNVMRAGLGGIGRHCLAVEDVDGDGRKDVVFGNHLGISWCRNLDNSGSYAEPTVIVANSQTTTSLCADLDSDGDVDVLWGGISSFMLFTNDGNGAFEATDFAPPAGATQVSALDFDGDGRTDLVGIRVVVLEASLVWWRASESGGFEPEETLARPGVNQTGYEMLDADDDGDMDFAVSGGGAGGLTLFFNPGSGGGEFVESVIHEPSMADLVLSTELADLDQDGDLDVAWTSSIGHRVAWSANSGDGAFAAPVVLNDELSGPRNLAVGDLNGDGLPDLAIASLNGSSTRRATWMQNLGGGLFDIDQAMNRAAVGEMSAVRIADIDGDGWMDAVFTSRERAGIVWCRSVDGKGLFTTDPSPREINIRHIFADFTESWNLAVGQLDDDAMLEIIGLDYDKGMIYRYDGVLGDRTWTETVVDDGRPGIEGAELADLDGDGDLDLITSSTIDSKVAWYRNEGGTFSAARVLNGNGAYPIDIGAGDLDLDGDLDLVVACSEGNQLVWFENRDGAGRFSTARVVAGAEVPSAFSVSLGDINGDGRLDIVTASPTSDTVLWFENHVDPSDVDGDGLPDDWEGLWFSGIAAFPDDDADGDGSTNGEEFSAGTDPTSALSTFRTMEPKLGSSKIRIRWQSVAGRRYRIERSETIGGVWEDLQVEIEASGDECSHPIPMRPLAREFYRVRVAP